LNGDGFISKEEMITMLKSCLVTGKGMEDDDGEDGVKVRFGKDDLITRLNMNVKELVDMTMRKMDIDKDGRVSFQDFEQTVKEEILLLEAFGPCLPTVISGGRFAANYMDIDLIVD
jgi:Ca2+-binding EF-hand superfamily protein